MARLPVGAEVLDGGVRFRVWAPARRRVQVVIDPAGAPGGADAFDLAPEEGGYFSAEIAGPGAGTRYGFRLDDDPRVLPDPVSRRQPEGPHGPSEVVDPSRFEWHDAAWRGVRLRGQVLYEMHVGTFTPEGTWAAAARELPELREAGITVVEMMPVAEFAGRFGWGYDGVDLFAPTRLYGTPDDLRRFVDTAHALGLGVLLDVVYNHVGPAGNYLREFSPRYFTDRYANEWGDPINFDGPDSGPVREFFVGNAGYWIDEFHFDGLRLDATQSMHDASEEHVLAALVRRVREAAGGRSTLVIAENEPQHARLARPASAGGYGLDALWNDDFHHSAMVAMTGRDEAYYSDHRGTPQELVSAAKWGYLYQGQYYRWQRQPRGRPALDVAPPVFVNFTQNHDQVANSARGARLHQLTSPGRHRAMTALLLLLPGTPMLFQGQEFDASAPFLYFADHERALADQVRRGRFEFLRQFPSIAAPDAPRPPAPDAAETFARCRLDLRERETHAEAYALHKDLLRLRRRDETFARQGRVDGAVLGDEAFVLRFFGAEPARDRLLLVNLGRDLELSPLPEPLLAPPEGGAWTLAWSSEHPDYGGSGTPLDVDGTWRLPGQAALVLAADAA